MIGYSELTVLANTRHVTPFNCRASSFQKEIAIVYIHSFTPICAILFICVYTENRILLLWVEEILREFEFRGAPTQLRHWVGVKVKVNVLAIVLLM